LLKFASVNLDAFVKSQEIAQIGHSGESRNPVFL